MFGDKKLALGCLLVLLFASVGFSYPQSDSFKRYVMRHANCKTDFGEPWAMVLVANGCYFDVAVNLVLDLRKTHDTSCVLLFTDKEGVDILKEEKIGVEAYDYDSLDFPLDILSNYTPKMPRAYTPPFPYMTHYHSRYTTPNNGKFTYPRWPIWMLRHSISLSVLELGVGVFQSDVDVAYLDPPSVFIHGDFDVQGQTQRMTKLWIPLQPGNDMNLGFGFIRPTLGGVLHWRSANAMMRYRGLDPQSADNLLLFDAYKAAGIFNQTEFGVSMVSPMVRALWWKVSGEYYHPAGLKNNKFVDMSKYLKEKDRWFIGNKMFRNHVCGGKH